MEEISKRDLLIAEIYKCRKGSIDKCKECSGLKCCGLAKKGGIIEPPYLTKYDLNQIEYYTGLNKKDFAAIRRNPISGNLFYVMKTKPENGCIFFNRDDGKCKVHLFRPMDCRLFPLDIDINDGEYYWVLFKYEKCNIPKVDLLALLAYRERGNGLIVKTKSESSLRCMSFNMPKPFASDDKPRKVYRIPLRIDATSLDYIFE